MTNAERATLLVNKSADAVEAAREIRQQPEVVDRVCWHLDSQMGQEERDRVSPQIRRKFADLDDSLLNGALVDIGWASAEVWDHHFPTPDWLSRRALEVASIADITGLILEAWSYEPKGHPKGAGVPQVWLEEDEEGHAA